MSIFGDLEIGDGFVLVETDEHCLKIQMSSVMVLTGERKNENLWFDRRTEVIKTGRVAIAACGVTRTY